MGRAKTDGTNGTSGISGLLEYMDTATVTETVTETKPKTAEIAIVSLSEQGSHLESIMGKVLAQAVKFSNLPYTPRAVVTMVAPAQRGVSPAIRYIPDNWGERNVKEPLCSFNIVAQQLLGLSIEQLAAAMLEQALVAVATAAGLPITSKGGRYLGGSYRKFSACAAEFLDCVKDAKFGTTSTLTNAGAAWAHDSLGIDQSIIRFGELVPEPEPVKAKIVRTLVCAEGCAFPPITLQAKHSVALETLAVPDHCGVPMAYAEADAADAAAE